MLRKIFTTVSLPIVIFCIGCAYPLRTPVAGYIYTGVRSGENATGVAGAQKRGEACAMSILGIIAVGDASIKTATTNGGISQVSYIDTDLTGVLGVYAQHCTVVYGN
jgi:hypothetical protein